MNAKTKKISQIYVFILAGLISFFSLSLCWAADYTPASNTSGTAVAAGTWPTYDNININNGVTFYLAAGTHDLGAANLIINSGGTIICLPSATTGTGATGVIINTTGNITVNSGGSISANGQGYAGGARSDGLGPGGGGAGGGSDNGNCGGGGYGGAGGNGLGLNGTPYLGGGTYGSITQPVDLGSGGGGIFNSSYTGGAGGGAIKIITTGTLTLNGSITANGINGSGDSGINAGGGGGGGSIWIIAANLTGDSTGSGSITANGGSSSSAKSGGGGGGRIVIDPATSDNFLGSITASPGYRGGLGTIVRDTASTPQDITIASNISWIGVIKNSSGNSGSFTFNSLTVNNGVTITADVSITTLNNCTISGIISANGQGYAGGTRSDGLGLGGGGAGGGSDNGNCGGGGYGGAGGNGLGLSGTPYLGGGTYGSTIAPADLGSGGGGIFTSAYNGGAGGGYIKIASGGILTINGSVTANGGNGLGDSGSNAGGGGSGGSIWFIAGTLAGSGSITANGGSSSSANSGAGGGGRIALYYSAKTYSGGVTAATGSTGVAGAAGAKPEVAMPTFTLLTPSAASLSLTVGESYAITWSNTETITGDIVTLYYSSDGGSNYTSIVTGLSNSVQSYSWTVPAVQSPGTTNKIKISAPYYQASQDSADTDFSSGILSNTAISGSGAGAEVALSRMAGSPVVGTYSVGTDPRAGAFDPVTNSIWVINNTAAGTINKVRASDGSLIGTYAAATWPGAITFDPVTNSIWVAGNAVVSKIRPTDGTNLATYVAGSWCSGIAFDPVTNSIWIANGGSDNVSQLSTVGLNLGTYAVGDNPINVAFDPSTNSIWVANYNSNNVSKLSIINGANIGTYTGGSYPNTIAFDSTTNSVWVASYYGIAVSKLSNTGLNLGTYTAGSNAQGVVFDSQTNSVWVTNYSGTIYNITKLRVSDGTQLAAYPVGSAPFYAVFDSSTGSVWTVNQAGKSVTKISVLDIAKTGDYVTGNSPYDVAFDSSTNSIWVVNYGASTVSKLSTTGLNLGTYTVGALPRGVAFDSSTNSIWVSNYSSNNISKLSTTGLNLGTYTVGTNPYGVAFDSSTNSIWVTNNSASTVSKLSTTGLNLGTYTTVSTGPRGVAFDSSTNSIWTANATSSTVSNVSVTNGTNLGTYAVGSSPQDVAFDSSTNSIWVVNYGANTVSKLSTTGLNLGTYTVGTNPYGIAFDSVTNSIWVANYGASSVSKLSTTGLNLGAYTVGTGPIAIAIDSVNGFVWVANNGSNTVTKYPVAPYYATGAFTSRSIDTGSGSTLSTFNYTGSAPTGTTLQFQVAGSADNSTWSDFIGSDGTSATYLTSGADIPAALASDRYIKYKALFTADGTATPALSDASIKYTIAGASTISDVSDNNFSIAGVSMSSATVTPASLVAGVYGNVTVAFTNASALAATGKVVVTFPSGFSFNQGGTTSATLASASNEALTVGISGQVLTLTRPGTGSEIAANTSNSITLTYIKNPVSAGSTGSYAISTTTAANYVQDSATASASTIVAMPLTLTSPDPATTHSLKAGASQTISWTSASGACPAAVNIKYSIDSGSTYILAASGLSNSIGANSYTWTVPGRVSAQVRVKVEDTSNAQVYDASDVDFSIAYPTVTITSPNGGENWAVGSTHNITWTSDSASLAAVKLEYSTDAGTTWNLITASAPDTGSYSWTMSNLFVTDQLKIRATGLISSLPLTISGTAAAKVETYATLEGNSKILVINVLSDFSAGESVVISGVNFTAFSVSAADNLGLDIYNSGLEYVRDDKIISVSSTGSAYLGGAGGDGWSYAESS